jgi:hypothetical protein
MSTFLELVQDLQREVGASGSQIASVVAQVGENQRMVRWVQDADFYIQNRWLNWKFLWNQVQIPTVPGNVGLAAPTDLNFWDYKTFKINDGTPGDEDGQIIAIEHDMLKTLVRDNTQAKPGTVIIMPDNTLEFEPVPDAVYQIKADYFRKPTKLAANNDVSRIPEQYHQAILGRAMALYANYEAAPEIKAQGEEIFEEAYGRLENHELPNQRFSRFQSTGSFFDVNANGDSGGFIVGGDGFY